MGRYFLGLFYIHYFLHFDYWFTFELESSECHKYLTVLIGTLAYLLLNVTEPLNTNTSFLLNRFKPQGYISLQVLSYIKSTFVCYEEPWVQSGRI